jgi:hypothetical protein
MLVGRRDFDTAVAVLLVDADQKRGHPLASLVLARVRLARVIRLILNRPEKAFRVGVAVGGPWPGDVLCTPSSSSRLSSVAALTA